MKISVIVATRDRAGNLGGLLESLAATSPPTGGWELVVVDNGSSDGTRAVVAAAQRGGGLPLRYYVEPVPGKPQALNTGVARASGDILVFTDDDCIVAPDWLVAIAAEFDADPHLGGVGGRVELYDPADAPVATRTGTTRRTLGSPDELFGFIIGANMAFRRDVLEEVGEFDVPTCEDIDLVHRAFRCGYTVAYAPEVLVYHNHGRRGEAAVASAGLKYLGGRGAFYAKYALAGDWGVVRMALRETCQVTGQMVTELWRWRSARPQARRLAALARGFWARLRMELLGSRTAR